MFVKMRVALQNHLEMSQNFPGSSSRDSLSLINQTVYTQYVL